MKLSTFISLLLLTFSLVSQGQESSTFQLIKGRVVAEHHNEALAQSNIYIKNSALGTVSNNDGEFLLKVPKELSNGVLVVSHIGFKPFEKPLAEIDDSFFEVKLTISSIVLNDIEIRDVENILIAALASKERNYPKDARLMTSFYRETIKKNHKYVDVSQGIINISKSSYSNQKNDDLHIVKGSRSKHYRNDDTLALKIMGGPSVMLLLDIVKNPGMVLNRSLLANYNYTLRGVSELDGRRSYTIKFSPKELYDQPLYSGTIYIDESTFAISGLEFGYDEDNLALASQFMVRRQPASVRVYPQDIWFEVKYREINGVWYLDYVRNEIKVKCNWKRKLFNSNFYAVSEMVVTDKNGGEISRMDKKNASTMNDIFSDKVQGFIDPNFWENYSIIEPEDDLRKALTKIEQKNSR